MDKRSYVESMISINGYKLEVLGSQGAGDPIFVFHGNSGSARSSEKLLLSSLAQEHRVLAFSLLGHGMSVASNNPSVDYSIAGIGNLIVDILKHYSPSRFWLLGQSVSAHAIMEVHYQFSGCLGFISISAPPISAQSLGDAFLESPAAPLLFKDKLNGDEMATLSENFSSREENRAQIEEGFAQADPMFRTALGASVVAGDIKDEMECIRDIAFPCLFLAAEEDQFISIDYYTEVSRKFDLNLDVQVIKGSGHSILLDSMDEAEPIIKNFICRNS